MEGAHHRHIVADSVQQSGLPGDKGTVDMDNIALDHIEAVGTVGVQIRYAHGIAFHGGELHAQIIHQLKGVAAPVAGIRLRRHHIALVTLGGKIHGILINDIADSIHNGNKGIGKLKYFHQIHSYLPSAAELL